MASIAFSGGGFSGGPGEGGGQLGLNFLRALGALKLHGGMCQIEYAPYLV